MHRRRTIRWVRGALAASVTILSLGLAPSALALGAGDAAPAFSLPDLEGKGKVDLSQYRGKVVWLDFWASWCPPCLSSLPELEKMRKQMPAKEFQIVAINVDKDPKKARKFLKKNPVGYPSASDPKGSMPEMFGLETMPTSYLIDRDGTIKHVHKGYRDGDIKSIRREVRKLVEGGK
jgi:peroxiredoxin